ncbi:type IV secretion system DNA-binding domain-containing protein, partial [Candidatus Peregrinibacteria bacterium]|nr:type IV secretion system DNA-binding domain-containing protein [Candidatus Peregrinibacteria bacterium]
MFEWILNNWWQTLLILVGAFVGWKLFWFVLRYWWRWSHRKDMVYMKVTMSREESQKDKEKATEKDFREKIGIMEQLYRALSEIRELGPINQIKVWLFQCDQVSFEIAAEFKKIDFWVVTYEYYVGLVEKQITSFYPDADIHLQKEPPEFHTKGNKMRGLYLWEKMREWYPIKTYKTIENDPLNDLTNVFSKLEEGEKATIQMIIRPLSDKWQKKAEDFGESLFKGKKEGGFLSKIPIVGQLNTIFVSLIFGYENAAKDTSAPGASSGDSYVRMLQTKEEIAKHVGEKAIQDGFRAVIRVLASAPTNKRLDQILNNVLLGFTVFKTPAMNFFQSRRVISWLDVFNTPVMWHNFRNRYPAYGEKTSLLVSEELATIYHFPNSRYNYTPVINWLSYKVLPAPQVLSEEGIMLGNNVYRGEERAIRFGRKDRRRHHYCIGQTGTGKSVFLGSLARQDMKNGDGLCVIDPHGDLIEDILQYVPKERAKDVIVFSPADAERPMGLNILEADTPEQQDMASSQATEIFIKIFGDEIFGPRIQHYFRNACLTLMSDKEEGATLIDVPRMFTDEEFMKYKVSKVQNPVVRSFWEHEYANTGDRERQEMIPYFSSKFGPFITNTIIRNTIGQSKSAFNFRKCMDEQKILLVNLSKGKIGELNTQLLGLVMVAQIQMAAMSRVDTKEDERKDFYLYVDEFQNFATDTFCSILSEARKYRLCLIMAHQYINQLVVSKFGSTSTQIRDAVFGNVGTLQSFKVGAEDGEYLAKEYAPILTEQDIIGISNYKAYIKLNIKNSTSRPFSIQTIFSEEGRSEKIREIVRQYSRMKYGRKKIFVDQEIQARIGIDLDSPKREVNLKGKPGAKPQGPLPP